MLLFFILEEFEILLSQVFLLILVGIFIVVFKKHRRGNYVFT